MKAPLSLSVSQMCAQCKRLAQGVITTVSLVYVHVWPLPLMLQQVRLYETDSPSQHPQHKHSPDTPAVQEQQQQQQQQADKPGDNGWLVRLLRTRHRLSAQQTEGDAQQSSSSSWALEDELANRPYRCAQQGAAVGYIRTLSPLGVGCLASISILSIRLKHQHKWP
jgi:hypothetical protein